MNSFDTDTDGFIVRSKFCKHWHKFKRHRFNSNWFDFPSATELVCLFIRTSFLCLMAPNNLYSNWQKVGNKMGDSFVYFKYFIHYQFKYLLQYQVRATKSGFPYILFLPFGLVSSVFGRFFFDYDVKLPIVFRFSFSWKI